MNRRERRALERAGKIPKAEPIYTLKRSEITKAAFSGVGKQAAEAEIKRQILEADKNCTLDMDTMYLWTLHAKYGWGYKRLKQFYLDVFREHLRMREFYEMNDLYPERVKLKQECGIDLEEWYSKLFDENGNFKNPEEVEL